MEARRHAAQQVAAGMTQFLTDVQRMPESVLKRLLALTRDFIWAGKAVGPVAMEHLYAPIEQGGIKLVDLEARNQSIDIMWLKEYLNLGGERPLWAYIVDALLAAPDYIPSNTIPREPELRISPFLQTWKNLEKEVQSKRKMPHFIKALLEAAREHSVRLEGIAFSREILRRMPMWYHKYADKTRMNLMASKSKATECLRDNHKLRTV
ncbi:hypothetical protein K523DRAFT_257917, partial [Schizophyllum commune Tattone D]